jgi:beta-galactosidase
MNIRNLFTRVLLLIPSALMAQQSPYLEHLSDYIENLSVFEKNQEPGRAYFIPTSHLSLCGQWKFLWTENPYLTPKNFYRTDFNDKDWNHIEVPSNWEMLGYGDKMFRNVSAPFHVDVPHVPKDYNPTGAYRKSFILPKEWTGKQIFLRMEKVASASFVWINGKEVGYNEGAQEPAEFNITPYLKPGKNLIAIHVIKYCDGYYLEGQDYWRLAGIFDDILIYSTPNTRLADWHITTSFNGNYKKALLKADIDVKQYDENLNRNYKVSGELCTIEGNVIQNLSIADLHIKGKTDKQISISTTVKSPKLWSAETPNLYLLKMQLRDDKGNIIDETQNKIGFKETKIVGSTFLLNGMPIKVKAINSHMQHPEWGHVMKENVIRKDFDILKKFNFNAVRTSHYPPVNKYLELANEYGLYIIDETGDESHATEWVSDSKDFTDMYRERVRRMVLRDRNYPCVLFWSAGNESGEGSNIAEVIKEGKKYDMTRNWMYGGNAFSHPAEEIIGPRYPLPEDYEIRVGMDADKNDHRPSFMDEYLSVAGNGGGGMDEYWKVIYAHSRTMGGAIWDFVSPGLQEHIREVMDMSTYHTPVNLMGNAKIEKYRKGHILNLNGHDEWAEVYRQDNVEIRGNKLTLTMDVCPGKLIDDCGSFLTKGSNQFGLQQRGNDKIDFYIFTDKKYILTAKLPNNWKYNWHNLTAVYDGNTMRLFIDKKQAAECTAKGNIKNLPYPVNIGRNAETHDCETNVAICDAKIDNVGIFADTINQFDFDKTKAALWLDFENVQDKGTFYSYGIGARTYGCIWPDRTIQPEMWQMKKTLQPIDFSWADDNDFKIQIWNHNSFLPSDIYQIKWMLKEDTTTIQQGYIMDCIKPLEKKLISLPIKMPSIKKGDEYRIEFNVLQKDKQLWADKGFKVAWEQLELPWKKIEISNIKRPLDILKTEETDSIAVIKGPEFAYTFSKKEGKLISMRYHNKELITDAPVLNVWRAPLANEMDSWTVGREDSRSWNNLYGKRTATEQFTYGMDHLTNVLSNFQLQKYDDKITVIVHSFSIPEYNLKRQNSGFDNYFTYGILSDGTIELEHIVLPFGELPKWLFRIGLSMQFPKNMNEVKWYGRGPQENYPDRKTGYPIGIYSTDVKSMYEPYLLPEDYGLRTDNRWVEISGNEGIGIRFKANNLFNFNIYPYTTENLTKATYIYQLKESNNMTFNLDYSTSGVGCTACSILPFYKTTVTRYDRKITITPFCK